MSNNFTISDKTVDTNTTISNLIIGNYDIKLIKSGYQDWTTTHLVDLNSECFCVFT
jgi:hypothetical protein